jgi:hypothetical protein
MYHSDSPATIDPKLAKVLKTKGKRKLNVQVTEEDGVTEAKKMKSKDSNSFQTTCQHFSLNHFLAQYQNQHI